MWLTDFEIEQKKRTRIQSSLINEQRETEIPRIKDIKNYNAEKNTVLGYHRRYQLY